MAEQGPIEKLLREKKYDEAFDTAIGKTDFSDLPILDKRFCELVQDNLTEIAERVAKGDDQDSIIKNLFNKSIIYRSKNTPPTAQELYHRLKKKRVFSLGELRKVALPAKSWVVDGLIPSEGFVMLAGNAASSKSFFGLNLALHVAAGKDFFGRKTTKSNVLYLDKENTLDRVKIRSDRLEVGHGFTADDSYLHWSLSGDLIVDQNPKEIEKLKEVINLANPEVIIVDSMIRFFRGDENSSADANKFYMTLKSLTAGKRITWILLHHTNKYGQSGNAQHSARGSSDFSASLDVMYLFKKTGTHQFKMELAKERDLMSWRDFAYNISDVTVKTKNDGLLFEQEAIVKQVSGVDEVAEIVEFSYDPGTVIRTADIRECAENMGFSKNVADSARRKLLKDGKITATGKGRYVIVSSLPVSNSKEVKQT